MTPKNNWYVAALSREVTQGQLLAREIASEPLVLFRDPEGRAAALLDRCPHRFFPLSQGNCTERGVRCGYHGMTFGADGKCTHIPVQETIPKAAAVRSYPVVERFSLIWVWTGDPALADPASLPGFATSDGYRSGLDFSCMDGSEWSSTGGDMVKVRANYMLAVDNLMDLTHAVYVHKATFNTDKVLRAQRTVSREGRQLFDYQFMPAIMPSPANQLGLMIDVVPHDFWLDTHWQSPSAMILAHGACLPGETRENGTCVLNVNIITPETETTSLYFWAQCIWQKKGGQALIDYWREFTGRVFTEDEAALALQQQNLNRFGITDLMKHRPVMLTTDRAAVQVRRIVEEACEAETDSEHPKTHALAGVGS